jgi:putative oxidoreductase
MPALLATVNGYYDVVVERLRTFDGIAPLLLRLYLAPVMIQAGWNKLVGFDNTVAWFANPDWGLGLPFPALLAALAAGTEFLGGIALIVGLGTRLVAIPLMFTMVIAMTAVHWDNGWLALSDSTSWLANERVTEAIPRKAKVIEILKEHGNYSWLTGRGPVTVLNNGIEFAATYFVMLLTLLFTGGGRYTSLDYLLARWRATN